MDLCPCGSNISYEECCRPIITGERPASTAEQVMRCRYTAYAKTEIGYLLSSLHPEHRSDFDEKSTRTWAENSEWEKLEILSTSAGGPQDDEGKVEFIASFTERGVRKIHRESASFIKENGSWYYKDGETLKPKQFVRTDPKTGRNDPCPCGSGKKFKKCCAQ